jgi:DNA-binding transcriptional ArsR family regulator
MVRALTTNRETGIDTAGNGCGPRSAVLIYNRMVVDRLPNEQADRVFHALADSTRRDILLRTLEGQHNVSALSRLYPMSFAAVQKHVAVLEGAGLVIKQRKGREQIVRGNVDTMRQAYRLLEQLEAVWKGRIDRIGELLADEQNGGANP